MALMSWTISVLVSFAKCDEWGPESLLLSPSNPAKPFCRIPISATLPRLRVRRDHVVGTRLPYHVFFPLPFTASFVLSVVSFLGVWHARTSEYLMALSSHFPFFSCSCCPLFHTG